MSSTLRPDPDLIQAKVTEIADPEFWDYRIITFSEDKRVRIHIYGKYSIGPIVGLDELAKIANLLTDRTRYVHIAPRERNEDGYLFLEITADAEILRPELLTDRKFGI